MGIWVDCVAVMVTSGETDTTAHCSVGNVVVVVVVDKLKTLFHLLARGGRAVGEMHIWYYRITETPCCVARSRHVFNHVDCFFSVSQKFIRCRRATSRWARPSSAATRPVAISLQLSGTTRCRAVSPFNVTSLPATTPRPSITRRRRRSGGNICRRWRLRARCYCCWGQLRVAVTTHD